MITYTATYSPEDNKLRLYASSRLDEETYQRIRNAGFRWAPKQELFVAPMWTPEREDILIELAGEIEPEEMTMAERAEAKVERIDAAINKKNEEVNAFHRAANSISERFHGGQPILVGHHSERKARKDHERMDKAMQNASVAMEKARYLAYKAKGVELHANLKNRSDVRARRIKTLLAELRDIQRKINHGHIIKKIWLDISKIEDSNKQFVLTERYSGGIGRVSYGAAHRDLIEKVKTQEEIIELSIQYADKIINNPYLYRWVEHILNRLAYERGELGETKRYEGDLRPVILQVFARENGAHKPSAEKTENGFILKSEVPLPLHIGDGEQIELSEDEWRNLMQDSGYEVPVKIEKGTSDLPPLLNLNVDKIKVAKKHFYDSDVSADIPVVCVTKAEHAKIYKDYKGTRLSLCGKFRVRTGYRDHRYVIFFITDAKAHEIPDAPSIISRTKIFEGGE